MEPGGGDSGGFAATSSRKGGARTTGRVRLTYGTVLPVSLTFFTAQSSDFQLK
ncbi:MAG: hypothetical protein H7098_02585 [Oligoflexus sp.]|nr:hypothetical protein [Pseudopedobacter sp.]